MARSSVTPVTRRLSVGAKFGIITGLCTALVIIAGATLVSRRLSTEDTAQSETAARETAMRISDAVESVFQTAFTIVDSTHDSLLALEDDGIRDPHVYDTILKRMIGASGDRYGAWIEWDAADQPLDPVMAKSRLDGAGRFATYWHQNGMDMVQDLVPQEIVNSELYRVPHDHDQAYLLEPHAIDAVAGDPTLVTSFSRPLDHDGKVVGVVALDVKLGAISDTLSAIVLPAGASITVVSDGGIIAMSTTVGAAGRPLSSVDRRLVGVLGLAERGDGTRIADSPDGSGRLLTSWSAVRFAGVQNPWYLLMRVPERSLLTATSSDRVYFLMIAALALCGILATVLLAMDRLVAVPLRHLSAVINGLGQGLFDFQVRGRERRDEVGDIARAVERLQESGVEIARLQEQNGESEYQRQLSRRAELDSISTHFSQSIEAMVVTLGGVASTVGDQSSEVSANASAAVRRLGDASEASAAAKESMASVANATGSLLSTIREIGDRTRDGRAAAERVERHTASTDLSIHALRRTVGEIDTVASLIHAVADQINLIALNATIEAARAGEAGRGFSVVAQEIKELAAQTARATAEIGQHVVAVHKASGDADGSITEMKAAFGAMHRISADIATALEIQLGATGKIDDLVKAALGGTDGVANHLSALVHSSHHVKGAADLMLGQSGALGAEISGLNGEVTNFLRVLHAA